MYSTVQLLLHLHHSPCIKSGRGQIKHKTSVSANKNQKNGNLVVSRLYIENTNTSKTETHSCCGFYSVNGVEFINIKQNIYSLQPILRDQMSVEGRRESGCRFFN